MVTPEVRLCVSMCLRPVSTTSPCVSQGPPNLGVRGVLVVDVETVTPSGLRERVWVLSPV